jgi:saccharopine dehydrogenase-like NADP-dependent oxidoreductase
MKGAGGVDCLDCAAMRTLIVGAGGVGAAAAAIARRRPFVEHVTRADVDPARAAAGADRLGDAERFASAQVDAADQAQLTELIGAARPAQAVVRQTAINPIVALELLDAGAWTGAGVLGPEAFDAVPFLDLLAEYGAAHGVEDRAG